MFNFHYGELSFCLDHIVRSYLFNFQYGELSFLSGPSCEKFKMLNFELSLQDIRLDVSEMEGRKCFI